MKQSLVVLGIMLAGMPLWAQQNPLPAQGWRLVWSDEFELNGLPDTTKWSYEYGFIRNQEAQWYQSDNVWQKDGLLIIEARHEHKSNPSYRQDGKHWGQQRQHIEYTSGSINTRGTFQFLFGRLEVRARIPVSRGSWPAIWTLGSQMEWPSCGEIDLMEYYFFEGAPHIWANAAWGSDSRYNAVWSTVRVPFKHFTERDPDWSLHFHIWRMDWDEQSIRLYLDDELLNETPLSKTVNGLIGKHTNPFLKPQFILLNLALGGPGRDIDDAALPVRYEIDYVRVFERVGN